MPQDRVSAGVGFPTVLAAARSGRSWALERLYTQFAPAVVGFFRLQRAPDPDDLTSEVFLGVLRNLSGFQGDEAQFRSWLFTIAYRRLADSRRAARRRPAIEPIADHEPADPVDVEADVDRLLATVRVRKLCDSLPPAQRDVLLLRLVGRMTIDEVAELIGRSRSSVKALQRRGLAAVTKQAAEGAPR
jgi:RNA polymerase sigma-70 factor (ECF subfamily)